MEDSMEKGGRNSSSTSASAQIKFSNYSAQFLATFIATLGSFGLGNVLVFTAPALPDMKNRKDFGNLTPSQSAWIASLAVLGALVSGPITGILINKFGRKNSMLVLGAPFILGWLLIGFGQNLTMIFIGRFITGFTGGSFTVTVPVYVSECVQDSVRGTLSSAMVLMLVTGILFSYVIGTLVSWRILALICAGVPTLFMVLMPFMPESPRYLLERGKFVQASKSLQWLRGGILDNKEIEKIQDSIDLGKSSRHKHGISSWKKLWAPNIIKSTGVSLCLMLFQQLSGINAVSAFTVEIFESTGSTHIDPNLASILIGIVQVAFVFLSLLLVDRVGRKLLLISSNVVMANGLIALGTFLYLKEEWDEEQMNAFGWIPLVCVISFVVMYSVGVGPLPWVLMGELIPPHVKEFSSAIVTSCYWIFAFISTLTFETLKVEFGDYGCYWIYSGFCMAGALFTLFFVPETKGKSFEEIQVYFGKSTTNRPNEKTYNENDDTHEDCDCTSEEVIDFLGENFDNQNDSTTISIGKGLTTQRDSMHQA